MKFPLSDSDVWFNNVSVEFSFGLSRNFLVFITDLCNQGPKGVN